VHSDLWLFYYFLLIAGAMDPRQRTIEVSAPLVMISYLAATVPALNLWDWRVMQVVLTRLFFLALASLLARHIALARLRLSDQMNELSEQLSLSQERNRIAREIHDGVGHSLVNCILTLELCQRLVSRDPQEACKVIEQEKTDLRAALDDLRDYVHHLRPAELEGEPFIPLVRKYVARFSERTGMTARLDAGGDGLDLPPASRLVLLRILQEALTNAAKHSEATEVDISLAKTSPSGVRCVIRDNGRGFDVEELLSDPSSRQGFGLRTIRERAASIGGDARIESEPGEGTQVSVFIPG
jgi:signal transduction histidine kinase